MESDTRNKTTNGEKKPIFFREFDSARYFADCNGKGYPAWRVTRYHDKWVVECRPGGDLFAADGSLVKRED